MERTDTLFPRQPLSPRRPLRRDPPTLSDSMGTLRFSASAIVILLIGLSVENACAQTYGPVRYETPLYPPLSPWLKLYYRQAGPVDNYHSFVRPELQLRETLRRQDLLIQQHSAGMSDLRSEVTELQTGGPVRPTGAGGAFMAYSHYYDMRGPQSRVSKR